MSYASTILADSPLSYWKLDETTGTSAADSGSGGNTGTYTGTFTLNQATGFGVLGVAVSLPGASGDYILVKSGAVLATQTNASIEVWFKTSAGGTTAQCLYCERAASGNDIWKLELADTSRKIQFTHRDDAGTLNFITSTTAALNDGVWHHVVMTKAGTAIILYVDGVSVKTGSLTGNNTYTNAGLESRIAGDKGDSSVFLNGLICNVAAYTATLTATQVWLHWAAAHAFTTLQVDSSATAAHSPDSTPTRTITISTLAANEIIVLAAYLENSASTITSISSVSGGSLTWSKLTAFTNNVSVHPDSGLEIWWALAPTPLPPATVTVTYAINIIDDNVLVIFGVFGCYTANPWDDGPLPSTNGTVSTSPSCTGVNTFEQNDLLLAFMGSINDTAGDRTNVPTGFTQVAGAGGGGGGAHAQCSVASKLVSARQSGVTVSWGSMTSPVDPVLLVHALTADPPSNTFPAFGLPPWSFEEAEEELAYG